MLEHIAEQFLADTCDVDCVVDFLVWTPFDQVFRFRVAYSFHHKNVLGLTFIQ